MNSGWPMGAEVEIVLRDGQIVLTAAGREYGLEELVDGITPENRPTGNRLGPPAGT